MAECHIGCREFEALCAVRDYMVQELLGGIECKKATSSGYEWKLKDGRVVELRVTIKDDSPMDGKEKEMDRFERLSKIAQEEFGVTIKSKPPTGETFESLYGETTDIDRKEKQIEEISKVIDKSPWKVDQDATGCHINSFEIAEYLYNAGYRKQSEWISVEDDLPKNQLTRVLVFLKDDEFTKPIGFNKIDTDRYIDGKWARWGKYVTHWMPLPEAPKMKGGE